MSDPDLTQEATGEVVRMTANEAASHYGIHPRTVKKWINSGRLDAVMEDGQWIVLVKDDDADDNNMAHGPAQGPNVGRGAGPRGQQGAGVDLAPMAETIERLTERIAELSATSAMWQERALTLQRRLDDVTPLLEAGPVRPEETEVAYRATERAAAPPAPAKPKRGFWSRLFLGPDPE